MLEEKVKKLNKQIEEAAKKIDSKAKEIDKTRKSITKNISKSMADVKNRKLKRLNEEKKKMSEKVKNMKSDFIKLKKEAEKSAKSVMSKKTSVKTVDKNSKEIMKLLATYNKMANEGLMTVLANIKDEDLKKDGGAYFKSILGVFNHILQCDMYFFKTFRKYSKKTSIANEELLLYLNEDWTFKNDIDRDIKTLFDVRKRMDNLIIDIVTSIDDLKILGDVYVPGKNIKKSRYHLILHEINHDTHHRGEISVMLDQLGYKNDFSNLLTIV